MPSKSVCVTHSKWATVEYGINININQISFAIENLVLNLFSLNRLEAIAKIWKMRKKIAQLQTELVEILKKNLFIPSKKLTSQVVDGYRASCLQLFT